MTGGVKLTGLPERRGDSLRSALVAEPEVEVRRSKRRRQTVSAYRDGGKVVVLLPARMSRAEEKRWVADMLSRLQRSETRRRSPARNSDEALAQRCRELSTKYISELSQAISTFNNTPMNITAKSDPCVNCIISRGFV